ncbi:MAG: pyridoxamine 5'-phosphate oxidase family protein [Acidimicrobiales bacterium]|jgi:nitroimidazol reductase NimA-like FMN-containing flavoprotein (pyridoxamine 5'-phosphate oxidase superfamily)|nr:pyridoxamine 5'-phosphate oxidase family protein [Acidimicrobiales bacterium]
MEVDRNGLEVLSRGECLSLLDAVPIGRIGLSMHALPVVLPVNFRLHGDEVLVRTAEGSKLDAALERSVVAFEADDFDKMSHTGWSVLVRGTSRVISAPEEVERVRRIPLSPWANDSTDRFVAISTDLVTGRRVHSWYRPDGHEPVFTVAAFGQSEGRSR